MCQGKGTLTIFFYGSKICSRVTDVEELGHRQCEHTEEAVGKLKVSKRLHTGLLLGLASS